MTINQQLFTGRYYGNTYVNFYDLNLSQGRNVLLQVSNDSGKSAIYDQNMALVSTTTYSKPIYLPGGNYVVKASYASPTYAVLNAYIPSEESYNSLTHLSTGSYRAESYDNFYRLNIETGGRLFLVSTGDSASTTIYDKNLNYIISTSSNPLYLSAGDYIVHTEFNGFRNGVLSTNIPASLQAPNDTPPDNSKLHLILNLPGSEDIAGGSGTDALIYTGNRSSYTINKNSSGLTVISTTDGTDVISNIERLQFSDKTIALDISGNAGQTYRIYQAAFDRKPDDEGLKYWINLMDSGSSLTTVASAFQLSTEFQGKYGANPSYEELITAMYSNVLHRAPDQGGFDYWKSQMNAGAVNRDSLLVNFSESAENQANVIGVIQYGIELL